MHPKKSRHPLEPGSYEEAVLNLKTEILLDHSKRLSLADQDLVFTETERVFCETLTGGEELFQ
jgi:hypothetical protein